jgi:hypothetical protein
MTKRQVRFGQCLRCGHAWRMRLRYPKICPECKSKFWSEPKWSRGRPPGVDSGWVEKRGGDFEQERALTPTQRVELGFRLSDGARKLRRWAVDRMEQ